MKQDTNLTLSTGFYYTGQEVYIILIHNVTLSKAQGSTQSFALLGAKNYWQTFCFVQGITVNEQNQNAHVFVFFRNRTLSGVVKKEPAKRA